MGLIGDAYNKAKTYVTGKTSAPAPSAPAAPAAPTLASPSAAPAFSLSGQTGVEGGAAASQGVTNAQGSAARAALGAGSVREPRTLGSLHTPGEPTPANERLNPGSAQSRFQDLNGVSQTAEGEKATMDRCGASTLVAAAYYAGGTEGLKKLAADTQNYCKAHKLIGDLYDGDKELQKRIESGTATKGDLNKLQQNLYTVMAERQSAYCADRGIPDPGTQIGTSIMQDFINSSPGTKKMLEDNKMSISHVTTDGSASGDHFVLQGQHNGKPFVYDPYSIKENGKLNQITQSDERLQMYEAARRPVDGSAFLYSKDNYEDSRTFERARTRPTYQ